MKTLDPCICFDGSSKPMLCSDQCQAALKILGLTSEHKRMIEKEMERFELVGSQVLQDYFTDYQTAEIQLQASLTSYFCGLSRIASNADPCHRRFAARLAHRVTSDTSKPHYSNFAVNHVLPSSSGNNVGSASHNEKLCILVELKCFDVESMNQSGFQKAFSQLMHAAALAFNAKQWDEQLCCCLGSLTHWHVFLLRVVRDPERNCPVFRISHYNEFALPKEQFDWDTSGSQVVNMYRTLFEPLLLCLLGGKSAPGHVPVS